MAISSGWQLAAEIGGGLLGTMLGGNLMSNSAASQQDRQFSHNWGLMDRQAFLNRQAMDWQHALNLEAMRVSNAYNLANYGQRYRLAVRDLRGAGLNPILAATQGVGGNIQGMSPVGSGLGSVGLGSVGLSQIPDYMSGVNSAIQGAFGRSLQKKSNELVSRDLDLKERDINSAIAKRAADVARENMMADITKWSIEEQNKQSWKKVDAEVENLRESLRVQEEHFIRADQAAFASAEAHALAASAAWHSSQVQSKLADIAEKTGYTQQQLNKAHEVLVQTQTADAEQLKEWHTWLNDHKELRGAVGLVGSMWDTYSTAKKVQVMSNAVD